MLTTFQLYSELTKFSKLNFQLNFPLFNGIFLHRDARRRQNTGSLAAVASGVARAKNPLAFAWNRTRLRNIKDAG